MHSVGEGVKVDVKSTRQLFSHVFPVVCGHKIIKYCITKQFNPKLTGTSLWHHRSSLQRSTLPGSPSPGTAEWPSSRAQMGATQAFQRASVSVHRMKKEVRRRKHESVHFHDTSQIRR